MFSSDNVRLPNGISLEETTNTVNNRNSLFDFNYKSYKVNNCTILETLTITESFNSGPQQLIYHGEALFFSNPDTARRTNQLYPLNMNNFHYQRILTYTGRTISPRPTRQPPMPPSSSPPIPPIPTLPTQPLHVPTQRPTHLLIPAATAPPRAIFLPLQAGAILIPVQQRPQFSQTNPTFPMRQPQVPPLQLPHQQRPALPMSHEAVTFPAPRQQTPPQLVSQQQFPQHRLPQQYGTRFPNAHQQHRQIFLPIIPLNMSTTTNIGAPLLIPMRLNSPGMGANQSPRPFYTPREVPASLQAAMPANAPALTYPAAPHPLPNNQLMRPADN